MIKSAVADFIIHFLLCRREKSDWSDTYFPDYELVVILATQRSQVLLVVGEGQALDEDLVHLEPVHHLERVEVPDDDVGLHKRAGVSSQSTDYLNSKAGLAQLVVTVFPYFAGSREKAPGDSGDLP